MISRIISSFDSLMVSCETNNILFVITRGAAGMREWKEELWNEPLGKRTTFCAPNEARFIQSLRFSVLTSFAFKEI